MTEIETSLRYGEWPSPISAKDVAQGVRAVGGGRYVGDDVWWTEVLSAEAGRTNIRRKTAAGVVDVLPSPWNARTRVHEYGGGAWTAFSDNHGDHLVFSNYADQRVYRVTAGSEDPPLPLTSQPPSPAAERYADLQVLAPGILGDEPHLMAIRERHGDGGISRDIVLIPLDGSSAAVPAAIKSVVGGSDFLAMPAISPDGRRIAWIAWNHPQMPWDGTELRIADLDDARRAQGPRTLLGSATESVLQPTWLDDRHLLVTTDRTGWWNLHRIDVTNPGSAEPLAPMQAEVGGPLWTLDMRWFRRLEDGRIAFVRSQGTDGLVLLDPSLGTVETVELPGAAAIAIGGARGQRLLINSAGPTIAAGLRELDLASGDVTDVRMSVDELPDPGWLPSAQVRTFTGRHGQEIHAIVYPPTSPEGRSTEGEAPPYIVRVHGGPTAQVKPHLDIEFAFWTSRGIGIIDVNYGGSSGFGRDYRQRLRHQWGIVDVEDVVDAALALADAGLADRHRLAIEGGSAGGWTVLASLTSTGVFACGVSYFGVAELLKFVEMTHDFESRYIDGLIGPLPEAHDLYVDRAPLSHVDDLSAPVLLLQGLDDPVVPPSQAEMFRDALRRKGIRHAYIAFEGESHGFRKAETTVRSLEASLSFLGQVFGFDPPGVPALPLD